MQGIHFYGTSVIIRGNPDYLSYLANQVYDTHTLRLNVVVAPEALDSLNHSLFIVAETRLSHCNSLTEVAEATALVL